MMNRSLRRAEADMPRRRLAPVLIFAVVACTWTSACTPTPPRVAAPSPSRVRDGSNATRSTGPLPNSRSPKRQLPYQHTTSERFTNVTRHARQLVYVPNQRAGTVQVIDPRTYRVIATYGVGTSPEHVVPSHDLRSLWVNSDIGNSLTRIDPHTGRVGKTVAVADPYNLYFTPDGTEALVMAERLRRIDIRDPHSMKLRRSLHVPCRGLNHADFTADLSRLVVSCEFSGKLLVLDARATRIQKVIDLNTFHTPGGTSPADARAMGGPASSLEPGASAMPQDVRLSPDGRFMVVADMLRNGVWIISTAKMAYRWFVHTGLGAHGIYPSRDATRMYVSNRDAGSVSVLDATTFKQVAHWRVPGGGSPDMGGVSADGSELWLSGRYDSQVYVFDTRTGRMTHDIPVRPGPHGLLVWPQPGRYSLGHTGNMR
jgi:YVTN family beta-propeller protein